MYVGQLYKLGGFEWEMKVAGVDVCLYYPGIYLERL
jgi:hypothetical protein